MTFLLTLLFLLHKRQFGILELLRFQHFLEINHGLQGPLVGSEVDQPGGEAAAGVGFQIIFRANFAVANGRENPFDFHFFNPHHIVQFLS